MDHDSDDLGSPRVQWHKPHIYAAAAAFGTGFLLSATLIANWYQAKGKVDKDRIAALETVVRANNAFTQQRPLTVEVVTQHTIPAPAQPYSSKTPVATIGPDIDTDEIITETREDATPTRTRPVVAHQNDPKQNNRLTKALTKQEQATLAKAQEAHRLEVARQEQIRQDMARMEASRKSTRTANQSQPRALPNPAQRQAMSMAMGMPDPTSPPTRSLPKQYAPLPDGPIPPRSEPMEQGINSTPVAAARIDSNGRFEVTQPQSPPRPPAPSSPQAPSAVTQTGPASEGVPGAAEVAEIEKRNRIEGVDTNRIGVKTITETTVIVKSGATIRLGERFPSGEKLLRVDPGTSKIVTDKRTILLL